MTAWMRNNLTTQGYCLSDAEKRELAVGLRFSTGLCLALVVTALALRSGTMLIALVPIGAIAGFTARHPFDYLWNGAVHHVVGDPALPPNPTRRRHAFKLATVMLATDGVLFLAGATTAALVLGLVGSPQPAKPDGDDVSTTDAPVDIDVLREEIQKTYTEVSTEQDRDFIFPTGRAWAQDLGYPEPELSRVPDPSAESFAGVANHFLLGRLEPGQTVVDLGCGAGTDLLIAAQMVGPEGRAIGIDMTPAMLDRARESADAMGLENVELHQGLIESLPLEDGSVDVVISNGVIDLVVDKDAVFAEIDRVLKPSGRLVLVNLASGDGVVSWVWSQVYHVRPAWVGGCRGVRMAAHVGEAGFTIETSERLSQFGVPSEVMVARSRRQS